MKRLIDVADLEKFISEKGTVVGDDHLLLVAADDGRWHEALPLIKTAYDVDTVIQEIEQLREQYFLTIANTDNKALDIAYEKVYQALDKAIEIVKAGVVND